MLTEKELLAIRDKWSAVPTAISARIDNSLKAVELTITKPHPITGKEITVRQILCETEKGVLKPVGLPVPVDTNTYRVFSRDEHVWLDIQLSAEGNACSLEVNQNRAEEYQAKSIPFPAKLHGKVITKHTTFYPPSLSDNGDFLLYLAEPVSEHSKLPWETEDSNKPTEKTKVDRFEYEANVANFGEQSGDARCPQAFICHIPSATFVQVPELDTETAILQAILTSFETDGSPNLKVEMYLNAIKVQPRRLGLTACSNRGSSIFSVSLRIADGKTVDFESTRLGAAELECPRHMVVNPVDATLWCLDNGHMGEHHGYTRFVNVREPSQRSNELCLPLNFRFERSPWANSDTLYVNCLKEGALVPTAVNLSSGQLGTLPLKGSILTFKKARILTRYETAGKIQLYFGSGPETGKATPALTLGDISAFKFRHKDHCLILERSVACSNSHRIGLYMHGGPNSVMTDNFNATLWFLMESCNFDAMVIPNYRGSLGYGSEWLKSLAGHVGEYDVADCRKYLMREMRDRYLASCATVSQVDKMADQEFADLCRQHLGLMPAVMVMGGSHGGFLAGHLIGQHPLLFKVAVMMNPVMDAAMHTTDIPDWAAYQFDGSTTFHATDAAGRWEAWAQLELRMQQLKRSPIYHVSNVRAAVFMALGAQDLRVDPHQGQNYYHALKELGHTNAVLYQYPKSNHSLSQSDVACHFSVKAAEFVLNQLDGGAKKPTHWVPECLAAQQ